MGYCSEIPACQRPTCGHEACGHSPLVPHACQDPACMQDPEGCEEFVFPEGQTEANFSGGGGGFGGGGATGGW